MYMVFLNSIDEVTLNTLLNEENPFLHLENHFFQEDEEEEEEFTEESSGEIEESEEYEEETTSDEELSHSFDLEESAAFFHYFLTGKSVEEKPDDDEDPLQFLFYGGLLVEDTQPPEEEEESEDLLFDEEEELSLRVFSHEEVEKIERALEPFTLEALHKKIDIEEFRELFSDEYEEDEIDYILEEFINFKEFITKCNKEKRALMVFSSLY